MTISGAFNKIAEDLGGTPGNNTVQGSINAVADALAGEDIPLAKTVEGEIKQLGEYIGGGQSAEVELTVINNYEHTYPETIPVENGSSTPQDIALTEDQYGNRHCMLVPGAIIHVDNLGGDGNWSVEYCQIAGDGPVYSAGSPTYVMPYCHMVMLIRESY